MPFETALPASRSSTSPARLVVAWNWQRIVNGAFAVAIASGCIAFVEPSPYDLLILIAFALWLLGGFKVHPLVIPFATVMFLYVMGAVFSLLPHLDEPDPTLFVELSVYLALSGILYAMFFAEHTVKRAEICLEAYAVGCVIAGIGAILGYFNIAGLGEALTLYDRASSTFKDPNVLGSYLVLGAMFYMQRLMLRTSRHVISTLVGLAVILAGIFLSFSRGSWGVTAAALIMMVGLTLLTEGDPRVRRRIVRTMVVAAVLGTLALGVLMSMESVRDMFVQRFALLQDYDSGETGRFGNQLHAIPMLLDRINGFGPVRFRLFFDEDTHNTYVGAFSSYGWLGGAAFFLLVGLTCVIGFRQVLTPSPFQRAAQVFFPTLFILLIQAVAIDIDHWRHIQLMFGAVWGIEAARLKWTAHRRGPSGMPGAATGNPGGLSVQPQ